MYTTLKRKTPLRAKNQWRPKRKKIGVGKIGKANRTARNQIAKYSEWMSIKKCEINLEGCMRTWPLAPAHRHKRSWYNGDAQLLAHPKQWVCACQHCHDKIEHDAEETEKIFLRLRGPEEDEVVPKVPFGS